jgi:branched-subunit amino acid transport protein
MTWTYILILAAIVFFNRYLFLEPKVDIKFPHFFENVEVFGSMFTHSNLCSYYFYQDDALEHLQTILICMVLFLRVHDFMVKKTLLSIILSLVFFYMVTMLMPS